MDQAAQFVTCQQTFTTLMNLPFTTTKVTPQVLEQWQDEFRDASELNAEGDYAGAVAACNSLVTAISAALA